MVIGKFQRNRNGNFVGYIDVPEQMESGETLRCLMVQDSPELGFGDMFMQMVWVDALER